MSGATLPGGSPDRYPGFDVVSQARHWDPVTAGVVLARLGPPPDIVFFTPEEEAIARGLIDHILGQYDEPRVPVVGLLDARLAAQETDGWHYHDMPHDDQAWRDTLHYLDEDTWDRFGKAFVDCPDYGQRSVIRAVQQAGSQPWHGLPAAHVWSLWTRYICTAFYSHPWAWNEIGFPGPAYPRGYKNAHVGGREPFEVADKNPADDPVKQGL
jgi:Gluconate 2-dehydrogenase subunit 3